MFNDGGYRIPHFFLVFMICFFFGFISLRGVILIRGMHLCPVHIYPCMALFSFSYSY